jgi:serine/threonine-protein kinase
MLIDRASDRQTPGSPTLKVLDFGLARSLKPLRRRFTNHYSHREYGRQLGFCGTPRYASPEQVRGHQVDERSDLYAVGVMLYEFLCGHRPHEAPLPGLFDEIEHVAPAPPSARNHAASISPKLDALVLKCLAKQPADRPRSASDLAHQYRVTISS